MKKIIMIVVCFFAMLFGSVVMAEPSILVNNYQDALILSEDIEVPILVIFTSDSCVYCDMLKENISDTSNIIICFIDYNKNPNLVRKYKVSTVPDSIIIDTNEKQLKRFRGFKDRESYKVWLDQ